jgi:hypothetical protein
MVGSGYAGIAPSANAPAPPLLRRPRAPGDSSYEKGLMTSRAESAPHYRG